MNVNLKLEGELEQFINSLVQRGLAANKTEAIRLAVLEYYEKEGIKLLRKDSDNYVDRKAYAKMEKLAKQRKTGKRKTLKNKDIAKEFPEFAD